MVLRLVLLVAFSLEAVAFSVQQAHPHTGKVTPFPGGDPGVSLDQESESILASGQPYLTKLRRGHAGQGLVVQDINAPAECVWGKILDFDNYCKMVPKTIESETYKAEDLPNGQKRICVRMKVGFSFLRFQVYFDHLYDPENNSLTWTLDYSKKSDFDDSVGFWYVVPLAAETTRVFYSVVGSMFSWVPHFVVDFMSSQALTDATGWVKKFSEEEYANSGTPALSQ